MTDSVLVVGGGISGIQASLDLAESGARVILVERDATIGGAMATLDKNFPTLDCSICIEAPKMSEVDLHPNIEILSLAEVESVTGEPGKFQVQIRQNARYVSDACTRCGDCTTACPVVLPNDFEAGMAIRKAIHTPIPQSTPGAYLLDMESCLNSPPNYMPCDRCYQACQPKAIDFYMAEETMMQKQVAAVVIAVGYDMMDPRRLSEFGYGRHPDVLTAMEFERLINSAGPTGGDLIRPSDGEHPESILFVLCVGSRDKRFFRYCSRFCCMYSIKHAYQALDHEVPNVTVLYMDVRAYGKGFDAFWDRTEDAGANFVRGRPSLIEPNEDGVRVVYENTMTAERMDDHYDMVVLANAVAPAAGLPELAQKMNIELDEDGFLAVDETHGGLVMTSRPGIFAAGCVTGPKDIPDSVAEGSGAAALALGYVSERHWPEPPQIKVQIDIETPRVGVFVCHCGNNIAGVVDVAQVVQAARSMRDVVYASDQKFSCAGNTQSEIEEAIAREKINRIVVAACSPKTHESIFRGVLTRSGLNPYLLEMANIRNMDSWVHKREKHQATMKAVDMVNMAVEKARRLEPLEISHLPLTQSVLVIGGGIAGMTSAVALARQGFETHLVEKESYLGGLLDQLDILAPSGINAHDLLVAKAMDVLDAGVHVYLDTEVDTVGGVVGSFSARLSRGQELEVGAIVIATGSLPAESGIFGYGQDPSVITNSDLEHLTVDGTVVADQITFVSCVGSRQNGKGCSRYCCTSMISQALHLRRNGKHVRVVSKDIRTYSRQAEELYEEAMAAGVQFFRYDSNKAPESALQYEDGKLSFYDEFFGDVLSIPTDLLVLVTGLVPPQDYLSEQLKLAKSDDGFLMELHPKLGPAETAIQGIYLAGTAQGAKDVRESMAQALAAAAKAGSLLSRGIIEKEPLTAVVDLDLCNGCMRCVKVCPFNAIEQIGPAGKDGSVRILEAACMGCGTCAAECNFDAIDMPYFTKKQLLSQIDAALEHEPEEKCLVLTCNWCSYAGADLAGIEKRQYPASARIIRTMCSARLEEDFISRAFEKEVGAVLVTGCRLTETGSDCHYNYANRLTEKRFSYWQRKFKRKGIGPERLQLCWISAAEGKEFAEKVTEMDDIIQRNLAVIELEPERV